MLSQILFGHLFAKVFVPFQSLFGKVAYIAWCLHRFPFGTFVFTFPIFAFGIFTFAFAFTLVVFTFLIFAFFGLCLWKRLLCLLTYVHVMHRVCRASVTSLCFFLAYVFDFFLFLEDFVSLNLLGFCLVISIC